MGDTLRLPLPLAGEGWGGGLPTSAAWWRQFPHPPRSAERVDLPRTRERQGSIARASSSLQRAASCFHRPSFEREQAARALLNEQNDQDQNGDLAEHGTRDRLQKFIGDAERERADQGAPEIADAAEHHDHEGVDDVALAEIGADVVDLR